MTANLLGAGAPDPVGDLVVVAAARYWKYEQFVSVAAGVVVVAASSNEPVAAVVVEYEVRVHDHRL